MIIAQLWHRFRSLILFGVSGVTALLVDIGVLYFLKPLLGLYGARVCSFLCAATFTWLFNRSITFPGHKDGSVLKEYLTYLSSMVVGGGINYLVYAISLSSFDVVRRQPAWGVAAGSLAGLAFNYLSARRIMQKRP